MSFPALENQVFRCERCWRNAMLQDTFPCNSICMELPSRQKLWIQNLRGKKKVHGKFVYGKITIPFRVEKLKGNFPFPFGVAKTCWQIPFPFRVLKLMGKSPFHSKLLITVLTCIQQFSKFLQHPVATATTMWTNKESRTQIFLQFDWMVRFSLLQIKNQSIYLSIYLSI